jgi:hypothetical protein
MEEEMSFTDYDGSAEMGPKEWFDDPDYDAWIAEQERRCGAAFATAGYDPYSSTCNLDSGHAGQHEGDNPLGDDGDLIRWSGGGLAGGDPLPYRDVEYVDAPRRLADLEEGELPLSEPICWDA